MSPAHARARRVRKMTGTAAPHASGKAFAVAATRNRSRRDKPAVANAGKETESRVLIIARKDFAVAVANHCPG